MALINQTGEIVTDSFRTLSEDEALPASEPVIVSLARWQKERDALIGRNAPFGLRLQSGESPLQLGDDAHRFALIAIEFQTFKDGRGFSYARRLREQMDYTGDIRAYGYVIPDQAQFLKRVGFTSVAVPNHANLESWKRGFSEFSVFYQTAADRRVPVFHQRRQLMAAE